MRLWHQSMASLSDFGSYCDVLREHVTAVVPPEVTVDVHGSYPGSYLGSTPAEILRYPVIKHLIQEQILDHCLAAERAGYDGIVLASFSEPLLAEVRSLVDIPVASMPESTLLVGCSCAAKVGFVTLTPGSVPRVAHLVANHGLTQRVGGIVALDPPITESILVAILNGDADPEPVLFAFMAAVRRLVIAGADLVIPAEGALNEVLWSQGVREVDGATVLDDLAVVMSYAQMLVQLKRIAGLGPTRLISYPRADPDLVEIALRRSRSRQATVE
jgi:allantoin racemase